MDQSEGGTKKNGAGFRMSSHIFSSVCDVWQLFNNLISNLSDRRNTSTPSHTCCTWSQLFQDLPADECVICVQVNGTEADYEYEEITLERVRPIYDNLCSVWAVINED